MWVIFGAEYMLCTELRKQKIVFCMRLSQKVKCNQINFNSMIIFIQTHATQAKRKLLFYLNKTPKKAICPPGARNKGHHCASSIPSSLTQDNKNCILYEAFAKKRNAIKPTSTRSSSSLKLAKQKLSFYLN